MWFVNDSHCAVNVFCPTGSAWDVAAPHLVGAKIWFRSWFGIISSSPHPLSLFPVYRLVRCSELAVSSFGVALVCHNGVILMGYYHAPLAHSEANDLLDGWAMMDVGMSSVSGVECRLCRAQCCPVRVHGTPDHDGSDAIMTHSELANRRHAVVMTWS